ncbi:Rieske 2Fe-2S domain-containing protein [Streptomyces sp. SID8381]|uniref:Rieske (2Fe-2S) protein n=1 Tax=unclassified Streptomyces TaxID=2593676 RepID=UPI00036D0004|nr:MULTISPECIES: Rieske (2Fe-2S) protein [unclassified Streptomyces]MYX31133.1 Rieske 2Fe-2S domain-containing protein [Streptomyces sp. SID8381]
MTENTRTRRVAAAAGRLLPDEAGPGRILRAVDRLERFSGADRMLDKIRDAVRGVPLGPVRDGLHGRWLGHPVHPLMVQLPIGSWLSAAVLDFIPGQRRAVRTLIATGLLSATPAAVSGLVDWAELHRQQMRVGAVHATANMAALALYTGSLTARLRGREARGKLLGLAGLGAVAAGGALGGHLAYRQASGANHAEHVPHLVSPGWHPVAELADLPDARPVQREIDGIAVVVVRQGPRTVYVLAERCSHMAGPLSEGTVENGCLRCPWHGSVFRLSDGWNVQGPATAPQPAFDTRIVDDRVEARLRTS